MRRRKWMLGALLALSLAAAGLSYGGAFAQADEPKAGYTCPLTGEELPCPNCCPLNKK